MKKMILTVLTGMALSFGAQTYAGTPTPTREKLVLAEDNILVMDSAFTDESCARVALEAFKMNTRLPSNQPIYLILYTPGGSIQAGLQLFDQLKSLNRPVHTITIFAASMGFQAAQSLGTRYLTGTGVLMAHKAKGGFEGEFPGQVDSRLNFWKSRIARLDQLVVDRSNGKLALKQWQDTYENEYWCEGQACVDKGVADAVADVVCDASLNGTTSKNLKGNFMGMAVSATVVKAACPLVTTPLQVEARVGNIDVNFDDVRDIQDLKNYYHLTDEMISKLKAEVLKMVGNVSGKISSEIR